MLPVLLMLVLPPPLQLLPTALIALLVWLLARLGMMGIVRPWPASGRWRRLTRVALAVAGLAALVGLVADSAGRVELKWLFVPLPVMGIAVCLSTMVAVARRGERPRTWLLTWIGIFGLSVLAAAGADALSRGSWITAWLMSVTLLCFAAGWLMRRGGRASLG